MDGPIPTATATCSPTSAGSCVGGCRGRGNAWQRPSPAGWAAALSLQKAMQRHHLINRMMAAQRPTSSFTSLRVGRTPTSSTPTPRASSRPRPTATPRAATWPAGTATPSSTRRSSTLLARWVSTSPAVQLTCPGHASAPGDTPSWLWRSAPALPCRRQAGPPPSFQPR
jgi:hypothetical protein